MNADQVKKIVEDNAKRYELLQKYDQVLDGLLLDVTTRMQKAGQIFDKHIGELLEKGKDLKTSKEEVLNFVRNANAEQSQKDIEASMSQFAELDDDIRAIIGLSRHIRLLEQRIHGLTRMMKLLTNVKVKEQTPLEMKKVFLKFGTNMQHVWKYCELLCKSYDEQVMFHDKVFKKKIGFDAE